MMNETLSIKRRLYRKICYLFGKHMPDKLYIQMMYQVKLGKKCDLRNPKSFDEKLNYLKLYDRRPEYSMMVDKYAVRQYIADTIGEEYLIPLIGCWERVDDIPYDELPEQFVLKCTHDSASVVICTDKSGNGTTCDLLDEIDNLDAVAINSLDANAKPFDFEAAKQKLAASMEINYFYPSREWPYKNIKPRIIAEKYMVDESGTELKDYKIYCANGEPYLIQVDFGRFVHHERNLYDLDWNYIDKQIEYPKNPNHQIDRPESLSLMLELAGKLSQGIPSVRVDFYDINGRVYFGEITFYQEGGFAKFEPEEYAYELGEKIRL